jgi:hypothetical protein
MLLSLQIVNPVKFYQPIDVKIDESNVVNPDLLIVCKKIEGQYLDSPPELVLEDHFTLIKT